LQSNILALTLLPQSSPAAPALFSSDYTSEPTRSAAQMPREAFSSSVGPVNQCTWGDGTHRRARNGTHRRNQLGLRGKCSRNESNRCSRAFQPLRFDHKLVSRVGTRARSGKATARIRDIGKPSPIWSESWSECPTTQMSEARAA